jgi:hypothetical protein
MRKSKYHGSLPPDALAPNHTVHRPKYHYGSAANDEIGTGVICLLQLLTPIVAILEHNSEHRQCWRRW